MPYHPAMTSSPAQYTDATRSSLQRIFGSGFTSPGGPEEMAELLDGIDITGKTVMDLGCGLGGDSLLLGSTFGAGRVVSADVDPGNLEVTARAVADAHLQEVIEPTLVEPGPMPFDDATFDLVHSKAMICHIDDKAALFREVHRVLKPGGVFAAADWMAGGDGPLSESYHAFADDLAAAGLVFFFKSPAAHADALAAAGFCDIELRDHSAAVKRIAEAMLENVLGEARNDLLATLGEDGYAGIIRRSRGRADALASGDLKFQFMTARK